MDSVFDSKGRKARRMQSEIGGRISENLYNLIMGGVILYGLLVNVIMCRYFPVEEFLASISPIVFLIGYFVLVILGTMIAAKSDNPVISFLGYNLIVFPLGVVVCEAVMAYGGMDSAVVGKAFLYTAIITLVMVCASSAFPGFFSKIGGFLFVALIGLIVLSILGIFLPIAGTIESYIGAAIFSLYIGYDMYKAQIYPKTADNAVDCAVDIYMDIVLLFLHLLEIFGSRD